MTPRVLVMMMLLSVTSSALAGPLRAGISMRWREGFERGFSAVLQLEIPLERLGHPRSLRQGRSEPGDHAAGQPASDSGTTGAPAAVRISLVRWLRAHSEMARAVVREALRVHGTPRLLQRLDELSSRSRIASLLPELMLRAARSTDQSLRLAPAGVDRYDLTQTGGADLLFEARASWDLDRLVFAAEELRIQQMRQGQAADAEKLTLLVLRHLFAWQRAYGRLMSEPLEPEKALAWELDLLEAETALEVLTDGFFGRVRSRWALLSADRPEISGTRGGPVGGELGPEQGTETR